MRKLTLGDLPTPPDGVDPSVYLAYHQARADKREDLRILLAATSRLLEDGSYRNIKAANAAQRDFESTDQRLEFWRDEMRREMRRVRG